MKSFLKKYVRKFYYAFSGLFHGITHDASIALQCILGIIALAVFAFFDLTVPEWIVVIILIALVITLEFVNSAVEHVVDFISPNYHPQAKIIKDYMAAAVLVVSIAAGVIACIILGGKLL